ncbi:hypothetical protein BpHYR1_011598 [Brachionus plicatilis]|uniref:Uncharacterized protein n=1 Tax=Brachionus plicatilis TaxID=10195 RepID=A0A3M7S381_BRAPC|nr:hypothetical protein BpHYR1_011598 [Brachionus plicatilis]
MRLVFNKNDTKHLFFGGFTFSIFSLLNEKMKMIIFFYISIVIMFKKRLLTGDMTPSQSFLLKYKKRVRKLANSSETAYIKLENVSSHFKKKKLIENYLKKKDKNLILVFFGEKKMQQGLLIFVQLYLKFTKPRYLLLIMVISSSVGGRSRNHVAGNKKNGSKI